MPARDYMEIVAYMNAKGGADKDRAEREEGARRLAMGEYD